jgi:hypothetical protein
MVGPILCLIFQEKDLARRADTILSRGPHWSQFYCSGVYCGEVRLCPNLPLSLSHFVVFIFTERRIEVISPDFNIGADPLGSYPVVLQWEDGRWQVKTLPPVASVVNVFLASTHTHTFFRF